jgi:dihydroorotase-like cyclic amidohydrolase
MIDVLVKNATIVDGSGVREGSLAVAGGRIAARFAAGEPLPAATRVIDAAGRLLLPGLVDPHVHFYGEGVGAYSRLAVRGGVTTFIGMIRRDPATPLAEVVDAHCRDGVAESLADFSFHVVLYDRQDTLSQIEALAARGFRSFKMFLAYKRRGMMVSDEFLFAALRAIRGVGGIALLHAEHGEFVDVLEQAAIAEGRTCAEHYEPTRPAEAEATSIEVVGLAAQATGCPVYIVHLSSGLGLAAVERARRRGIAMWAETCPQYLLADDTLLRRVGAGAKIAPPLRTPADCRALGTGLLTGAINTVGSDHASYRLDAKAAAGDDIFAVPFGMPGAPVLWPAMFTWALDKAVPLPVLVRAMAEMPARLFGLAERKGSLAPGADADLILVDPAVRQQLDCARVWPDICPSPLAERPLAGWPSLTMSRGEIVFEDGEVVGRAGRGRLVVQQERRG